MQVATSAGAKVYYCSDFVERADESSDNARTIRFTMINELRKGVLSALLAQQRFAIVSVSQCRASVFSHFGFFEVIRHLTSSRL